MKKMKYIIFSGFLIFLGMNSIHAKETCAVCGPDTLPVPIGVPNFISKLITLAQVITPIIIIVVAIIKYTKAVASGDEKVIKETNSSFIRSLITGVSIFLVVTIVKVAFGLVGTETSSYLNCVSCFLNGEDHCSTQVCPNRDGSSNNSSSNKVCSDYKSEGTCKSKDDNGNLCYWNTSLEMCEFGGKAKYCSEYDADECPSHDDYGYDCEVASVGGRPQCRSSQKSKYCSEYDADECPEKDGYGYTCKVQTKGGRPQCISYDRTNKR